jgi:hypothetical protein
MSRGAEEQRRAVEQWSREIMNQRSRKAEK